MTWLAWRQQRVGLVLSALILAAMIAFLVPTGLEKHGEFRDSGLQACVRAGEPCPELRDAFVNGYNSLNSVVGWFSIAPAVVALLLAAPIVSEFEQRTYRLAWTQSISRERWLAVRLGLAAVGAVAFAVALTALMTWWHAPLDRSATLAGNDLGQSYGFGGAMPLAYTLFALALAVAVGTWSGRLLVSMGVTLLGFVAVHVALEFLLRTGLASDTDFEAPDGFAIGEATRDMDRYWTVQAIEGVLLLGATALLVGFTFWLVRRRG